MLYHLLLLYVPPTSLGGIGGAGRTPATSPFRAVLWYWRQISEMWRVEQMRRAAQPD